MRNIALDEQRHIGFGVKLLADLYRELGEPVADGIAEVLREVLPWTAGVAMPPDWDRSYTESFGFTLEDLGEEAARSLEQKLRAIGLPVEQMRIPMDWDLPPRERAARGMKLMQANMLGPGRPRGPLARERRDPVRLDRPQRRRDGRASPGRRSPGTSPTSSPGTWC